METLKPTEPVPKGITEEGVEEFKKHGDYLLKFYRRKIIGINNLTLTSEIQQSAVDYKHRIKYIKRLLP